jgi:predicted RNA-binding Zn-ribbon protein involved in translation (DUF1610 family)
LAFQQQIYENELELRMQCHGSWENDDKFLDASTNESGRVDDFRTADFQDTENIEMDEEYNSIQVYAEINNTADAENQIEPSHGDAEESTFENKLSECLTINDGGELGVLNTVYNEEPIVMENIKDEMETENDKTTRTDENVSQLRNSEAASVPFFDNSENEIGNRSKISPGSAGGSKRFRCHCGKSFAQKCNLYTHKKTHDAQLESSLRCPDCGKKFSAKQMLARHVKSVHQGYFYECPICGNRQTQAGLTMAHIKKQHPGSGVKPIEKCDKK